MLLSVMLAQTVMPHSVQQMSMVFSLYMSFCFQLVTIYGMSHRTRESDQSVYRRCEQRLIQSSKEGVKETVKT